jgi:hypothetical protein
VTRIGQAALLFLLPYALWPQNLILNDQHPQTVIYELPGVTDRAVVLRSLEFLRNRFRPGAEIIDGASLDDAALRARIKGTFVLYSLLDDRSRLLKLAAQATPFHLENNTLHWGDLTVPTAGIRVVFVGKNPFGEGFGAVYAAGTPDLLARANEVFHGPKSYYLYQGSTLLREGFYDRNFVARLDHISREAAIADINQYFATIEHVHPNHLAHQTAEQYAALKKRTLESVNGKSDIQISDLADALVDAAATFRDGHTGVSADYPPNLAALAKLGFPPFWLETENGRFFVSAAVEPSLAGAELLNVNGKPAVDFFAPLCNRIPGETMPWKATRFVNQQAFFLTRTPLFGPPGSSIALQFRDPAGATKERTVTTLSAADYQKFFQSQGASMMRKRDAEPVTRVEFLENGRIAHLIFPHCSREDGERKRIDEIFTQIQERKSRALILDIRGNPGGISTIVDYLFTHVYAGKFTGVSRTDLRFTSHIPDQVWKGEFPSPQPPMKSYNHKEISWPKPPNFFAGPVYLLIDNGVFSSGVWCTVLFRDYKAATIIGYETGGVPQSFGNMHTFSLKNSGIQCTVSDCIFYPPRPRPGDDQHGVLPDIPLPLDRAKLQPYAKDPDPALAFTVATIEAR